MTNDQANAVNVLEISLDLIRQVLIKHETAVIAEFRSIIEAKNHELRLVYAERDELKKENALLKVDRDNVWAAFQRLRKAYAMVRYPTINEEIKLLYDTADAVAYGKDTSGDGGQNPTVTPVKPPART